MSPSAYLGSMSAGPVPMPGPPRAFQSANLARTAGCSLLRSPEGFMLPPGPWRAPASRPLRSHGSGIIRGASVISPKKACFKSSALWTQAYSGRCGHLSWFTHLGPGLGLRPRPVDRGASLNIRRCLRLGERLRLLLWLRPLRPLLRLRLRLRRLRLRGEGDRDLDRAGLRRDRSGPQ